MKLFLWFLFLPFVLSPLPANYGFPLDHVILSEYRFPVQSSISRGVETEHVTSMSTTATFFSHVESFDWKIRRPANPPTVPAPSPAPQGPFPGSPIVFPRRHHHRHRRVNTHPVSPSPSTEPDCGQICVEPLTSAVFLSPCGCVLPMKVRLVLQVSLYAIFPVVRDLAMEIAEGTYVNQKQVSINGASADPLTPEHSVVDINLIPLEEKFDNTTAMFICTRLLQKKVRLNQSLFGDYEVIFISYPGLPSSPPSGVVSGSGPTGSAGNDQFPITADLVNNSKKLSPRVIFVIGSSAFVLLVVCCGAIVVLLKCKKARRPSTSVGPALGPSIYKRSGLGSILSTSPPSSSSTSLVSSMPVSLLSVKTFSLAELRKATDKFSSKKVLGEGGFGRVYHGILGDGSEVAVKLLTRDNNQNGDREFIAEVEMLSRLHHRNLVKLIGICIEERTRCLVYELVSNGNVESHLHGTDNEKRTLDWNARLKIALGAARGLAYLHEDSNPRVIHRDFKASNVLLEDDFTPKVSDFGLAREATEGSHHISTRVMGTFGYVAPEYAMTGHLLVKSDVYSYGVVLLELLTGRKPVDMSQPPGQENLVTWARPLLTSREGVEQLVDPLLAGSYNFDDMAKVAAIASMCVHSEVTHRPFMGEVVQALKLICNDTDETCEDGHSQRESSGRGSDYKGDLIPSDSSWWNAGTLTPQPNYVHASFMTMDYSSGPLEEFEKRQFPGSTLTSGRVALPIKHGNRSGPLRTVRNPAFQRVEGSTSEHGGFVSKRAWNDGTGSDSSF